MSINSRGCVETLKMNFLPQESSTVLVFLHKTLGTGGCVFVLFISFGGIKKCNTGTSRSNHSIDF